MIYLLPKSLPATIILCFSIVIVLTSCGKKLTVVTYEKKRGKSRSNTTHTRKKEEYFDFDEKKTSSRSSANTSTTTVVKATGSTLKLIQTAQSYIGTPYRYGGTSRSGIDCSGLLCNSFESIGVKIPRSSNEQAEFGQKVSIREIAPGDMVFFSERKGGSKVTHAGLVTVVKGSDNIIFIHSSTSRGVVEDNLLSEYYQGIFVKAVRPY
ncbi:C40 family peptidase [Xanthocytophaga flava]|uniref:C40 family peptidase n=1 Tax=Xanthocytophaga flava TaxID=3048013 RepID=UPI0028D842B6|nr:C40 family peptidase [Xanthocytophaga flavus]MDJ1468527.1 C40 family peptidase [Xanthocytophaga flavus]